MVLNVKRLLDYESLPEDLSLLIGSHRLTMNDVEVRSKAYTPYSESALYIKRCMLGGQEREILVVRKV